MSELELILASLLGALAIINGVVLYRERSRTTSPATNEAEESGPRIGELRQNASKGPPSKEQVLAKRASIMRELEQELGTKVITLIHRKEPWTGPDEDPEIVLEDAETIVDEIRRTPPDKPIDLIVHTPGGAALSAQLMAMAIKFHVAKVRVFVPFYAMSGGSLLALAADEIRMEKYSILGPVDPQIEGYPASSYTSLLKSKSLDSVSDRMFIAAQQAEIITQNVKEFVKWLLRDRMDEEQRTQVAEIMAGGYMPHETMITMEPARDRLGLNVTEGIPDKVYEMFRTFDFKTPKQVTTI